MLTTEIAKYVADLKYENVPEEAVEITKMIFCDFLGVVLAGKNEEVSLILKEYVLEQGGVQECSVPGYGFKTNPSLSTLLCGTMGHALDYDDVAYSISGHSAVVLCPVIWALGDKYNITGKQAIEAFLAGFEGAAFVGKFLRSEQRRGNIWHMTKALGVLASTLAAAKIMNLTPDQIRSALGIAATLSGGLMANFGTMGKPFHAGSAAHDGILAATLAQKSFLSHMDILESERGFRRIFVPEGGLPEESIVELIHNGEWDIVSGGGVGIKLYPSCGGTHKSIHAAIELAKQEDINPEEVESVIIKTPAWVFSVAHHTEPKTGLQGKFSIEFTVAAALVDRQVTMDHFTDEKIKELAPLMKKVRREPTESASNTNVHDVAATAVITMKDGRVFTHTTRHQKGHPKNPLTWDALFEKYRSCVARHVSGEDIAASEDILFRLEELDRFKSLVSIFSK